MQKIIVEFNNEHQFPFEIVIEPILALVLAHLDYKDNVILSVALLNDEEIAELYEQYFGYAQPTDVLSFPSGSFDPESNCTLIGDVLIDFPFVVNQAHRLGNDLNAELTLLLIHGILHLLGYDHDNNSHKDEMWKLQNKIMSDLKIHIHQMPE